MYHVTLNCLWHAFSKPSLCFPPRISRPCLPQWAVSSPVPPIPLLSPTADIFLHQQVVRMPGTGDACLGFWRYRVICNSYAKHCFCSHMANKYHKVWGSVFSLAGACLGSIWCSSQACIEGGRDAACHAVVWVLPTFLMSGHRMQLCFLVTECSLHPTWLNYF